MATRRCRRAPRTVSASAAEMADITSDGSRSRRPITDRRTSWAFSGPASSRRNRANSPIRICTSSAGRAQLSEEKANRLRVPIPTSGAASTRRRIASTPAWCPAERGRPRRSAHRPLPSMITATWIEVLCMSKSPGKKIEPDVNRQRRSVSRVARIRASMWVRYRVSSRRPTAVSRYSVRGRRPSKVLVQVTRSASSSLRACTLRFPSVVSSSALISLNVSDSTAASALTMPRRMRWWMRLSRLAEPRPPADRGAWPRGAEASDRCRRAALESATVLPPHDHPEGDVQPSEAGDQEPVAPREREQQTHRAQDHEGGADDRNDPHRPGAGRDESRPVEQKPRPRQQIEALASLESAGEEGARDYRGRQAQGELSGRPRYQRLPRGAGLPRRRESADHRRDAGGGHPRHEPTQVGGLPGRHEPARRRDATDQDQPPAGERRERGGALHGLPDEAEIGHGPGMEGG